MAGTKYSFQVQIPNPADIQALREGGYQLGVVKKSNVQTGSAIQVQWLSVQILAGTISVSWDEEYFLYFTTQDLSKDGVTIMQGSSLAATMGQKYSYSGFFSDIGSASRPDGIEIENDLRSAKDGYGIAQKVSKNGELVQAPIIASTILMKGTAGFSFAEEVEVYFTNSKTYTGNDGIVAKYLDMSASKSIVLAPGVTSAVAYDNTTGTWTDVAPAVTGVPLALAMRPARITEIATLDDLFAYDPALDVNAGPIVLSMFKLAVPIVGSALAAWIAGRFQKTNLSIKVTSTNPGGVSSTQEISMTNIGNVNRDQIEAAAKALKDQSVPIPGGRYLAAAGVYQTLNTEDKILSVEIEKQDGTVAALRLILAQMAAAKKASGLPVGTNGAYGGYLSTA